MSSVQGTEIKRLFWSPLMLSKMTYYILVRKPRVHPVYLLKIFLFFIFIPKI